MRGGPRAMGASYTIKGVGTHTLTHNPFDLRLACALTETPAFNPVPRWSQNGVILRCPLRGEGVCLRIRWDVDSIMHADFGNRE